MTMVKTNIIQNGSFDQGNTGWTGTDLETNYRENAYLGDGSTNHVAEIDGHSGQTTVMEQTITLDHGLTTNLTFRTALRTAAVDQADDRDDDDDDDDDDDEGDHDDDDEGQDDHDRDGAEGFRVDILDQDGQVIASQSFHPDDDSWSDQSMPVTFPSGGTYTIRLTELGDDDSLGAIVDDISMLVCFTAGTLIETATGPRPVQGLAVGDLVWTLDAGWQPIRWIGSRKVTLTDQRRDPRLCPVVFEPGALGPGLPTRRMAVSPQHRILLGDWRSELCFGQSEVLVAAHALINRRSVHVDRPQAAVTYVHFLLDGHQIVRADGALSESFFPTALSLGGVDRAARAELFTLFPDLAALRHAFPQTARPVLRGREARLVA